MFEKDEEDLEPTDKFDECFQCKNKWKFDLCECCDFGEWFEEEDPDEVDKYFV